MEACSNAASMSWCTLKIIQSRKNSSCIYCCRMEGHHCPRHNLLWETWSKKTREVHFVAKAPGHYCSVGKHMKSDIIIFSFNYTKFNFEAENEPLQPEIPLENYYIFRFHINLRWCLFQSFQSLEAFPIVRTESEVNIKHLSIWNESRHQGKHCEWWFCTSHNLAACHKDPGKMVSPCEEISLMGYDGIFLYELQIFGINVLEIPKMIHFL